MNKTVFLSHNHADKSFVRKLAKDLEAHGVKCWLDEAEMSVGDSLIKKIREGIDNSEYFIVVLSPNSIKAPWVENELDVAMNLQIAGKGIKVLPLMLKDCELPGFLLGKLYGDFQKEENYIDSFRALLKSINVVFISSVFSNPENPKKTLSTAVNKAVLHRLSLMSAPFHRPFQYMGMTIDRVEKLLNIKSNEVGNMVVENDMCRMYLEVEGNYVSYIEVELKQTAPHFQNIEFDSEPLLGALSISLSELDLVSKQTHSHSYYEHKRKLKISVMCSYDTAPLSVCFSSKYYGE